ncbi:hypothetical protein [Mammaliicoccus sciuri]|uniref:hypothetical protein n=1 Tax=Mammaliicoccus sciuri TaxID=1296 RepID=UPI003F54D467
MVKIKAKSKFNEVTAIKFDGERWLYLRKEAYPMVDCKICSMGSSSLGGSFTFELVIETKEGQKSLGFNDYIIQDEKEDYYVLNQNEFHNCFVEVD